MYTYIHTRIHVYIHTHTHECIHAYMHTCIHACIHAYIHAYHETCDAHIYKLHLCTNFCCHGVAVNLSTDDRKIPGSTPGKYNLQIKITSKSGSCGLYTPSLVEALCGILLLWSLGTSHSHLGYHTVSRPPIHVCGLRIKCNQRTVSRPPIHVCGLRIKCTYQRDTQAIDYSWTKPWYYHAAQTSSARIQDVDVILIWRLYFLGVEPGISRSSVDRFTATPWCDVILIWRLYFPGVEPGISRSSVDRFTATPWWLVSNVWYKPSRRSGKSIDRRPWNPWFDSREIQSSD